MPTLKEVARYVRSKNAGPFWITIEIFCDTNEAFEKISNSPNLSASSVATLYGVPVENVKVFKIANLRVIKFSFPRPQPQGHKYENDMHAGQQYVRMLGINV
jgi:hypothetical protein